MNNSNNGRHSLADLPELRGMWERLLGSIDRDVAHTLDRALAGSEITIDEGARLFDAEGRSSLPSP